MQKLDPTTPALAVDDYSRLAYAELLPDEALPSVIALPRRAAAFYRRHGIEAERVPTDNGSAYRSLMHAVACRQLGIKHIRTGAYRPQRNGKAERFIRTMLTGSAYGATHGARQERNRALA